MSRSPQLCTAASVCVCRRGCKAAGADRAPRVLSAVAAGAGVSAVASSPVPFVGAPGAGAWAWSAGADSTADTKNRPAAARPAGLARRGLQAPDGAARPGGPRHTHPPTPRGPGRLPRRVPADLLREGAALRHGCGGAGLGAGLGGLLHALPLALPPARSPVGAPDPTARMGPAAGARNEGTVMRRGGAHEEPLSAPALSPPHPRLRPARQSRLEVGLGGPLWLAGADGTRGVEARREPSLSRRRALTTRQTQDGPAAAESARSWALPKGKVREWEGPCGREWLSSVPEAPRLPAVSSTFLARLDLVSGVWPDKQWLFFVERTLPRRWCGNR